MKDEEMAEQYAVENWEHYEEGQTDYEALVARLTQRPKRFTEK